MEEIWKKAVVLGAIGMILGIFVGTGFWLFLSGDASGASDGSGAMIVHLLLSGVLGMVANGSSAIYEIEEWGIVRATVTHFVITMGTYYTIAFSLGWFSPTDPDCWIMSGILVFVYFMIWLLQSLIFKHKVKRMNEELRRWKSMRDIDENFNYERRNEV